MVTLALSLYGPPVLFAGTGVSDGVGIDEGSDKKQVRSAAPQGSKTTGDAALDAATAQTMEVMAKVPMDEVQRDQVKGMLKALNYTNLRVLRVFCDLPAITGDSIMEAARKLPQMEISFNQLAILEHFVTLPGVDMDACWQLLAKLNHLNYVSSRVAVAIGQAKNLQPTAMIALIDRLATLNEPALWAFKAFLEVPGQTAETVDKGLQLLAKMNEKQCWATEKSCKIKGMNPDSSLVNMIQLQKLSPTDVSTARSLFKLEGVTPASSLTWMTNFFATSQEQQEAKFFAMNSQEKSLLIRAYADPDAADDLIWKINNLHDITEPNGQEVGIKTLSSCPASYLQEIFQRLDSKVQARFQGDFSAGMAAGRGAAIAALRRATGAARVQAAKDVITPNAYILLSRGSDLYDSSFREILVPVVKAQVDTRFGGSLLAFLKTVDPENVQVSDFIISLAQKGKLTVFFPAQVREQQQVLDLVTTSAFQNENSLILFSATFMTLLQAIQPETRTYLISKMLTAIREQNTVFSVQLRVILQYYVLEYPQLVGEVDKIRIKLMSSEFGVIPLDQYVQTGFAQWKSDGKLSSLSIFQGDDDGGQSFHSNCQYLMAHGYRPRISTSFSLPGANAGTGQLKGLLGAPSQNLGQIHALQSRYPIVVDWIKQVGGIEVSHSVEVYHNAALQQELLRQFLTGGHEMFAQRGHSYWRKEQLLDPLQELMKTKAISDADLVGKQRFLSLGSCGGIRAYSELATFFHNKVDILATVGTGKAIINDPYNQLLFELVASRSNGLSWEDVSDQTAIIFKHGMGEEYLQPGSLPAILHKIMDQKQIEKKYGAAGMSPEVQDKAANGQPPQNSPSGGLEVRRSAEDDTN